MDMKKAGQKMSLCMGITMSFFLSLTGLLSSGHFTIPSFVINFLISTVISLVIGLFIPMKKITDAAVQKTGMTPGKFGTRCFESLISDLIYTPVMTFCMVAMAHHNAVSHGQEMPPLIRMYLPSLGISMLVGFVLIFIITPVYTKMIFGKMQKPEDQ